MDPVTIGAVIAAVAGGAGGALGTQLWAGVYALVHRPFRHAHLTRDTAEGVPDGAAELAALEQTPSDGRRAVALAEALLARAGADPQFRTALEGWWEQSRQLRAGGNVISTISGGTQHGPVLQGRDFTDLTFGSPVVSSPSPDRQDPDRGPATPPGSATLGLGEDVPGGNVLARVLRVPRTHPDGLTTTELAHRLGIPR
jgi:hypothetical protein